MKVLTTLVFVIGIVNFTSAETIRGINIDFVTIGNAGNVADTQVMTNGGASGYGSVNYKYRIGKYEVTNAQWNAFTTIAGVPTGNDGGYGHSAFFTDAQQPANNVSWYEALQFCNYLTSGDKSKGAYLFSGDDANPGNFIAIDRTTAQINYGIIYMLPTENEWYKAAYYKPGGSGYSLFSNGQNTIPPADNGWNYYGGSYETPWNVGTGTLEQNGTYDMTGNVWEWNEASFGDRRGRRGGSYSLYNEGFLMSSGQHEDDPFSEVDYVGFRVVSIPEPATLLLLGLGGMMLRRHRS